MLDHSGVSGISIESPFNETAVFWFTWHCGFVLFMAYFKVSVCGGGGGGDAVAQLAERKTHGQEVAGFPYLRVSDPYWLGRCQYNMRG